MKVVFRCFPEWEALLPKPAPASDALPEWLKSMPAAVHSDILGAEVRTAKHCVPFIDALSRGFLVPPCRGRDGVRFELLMELGYACALSEPNHPGTDFVSPR